MQQADTHEYRCPSCGKRPAEVYESRSRFFGLKFMTKCCQVTAQVVKKEPA